MIGALSQNLTFQFRIAPGEYGRIHENITIGDIWRTPRELVILHRMVMSERQCKEIEGHFPMARATLYHGILRPEVELHGIALARGTLRSTFYGQLSAGIRQAILHVLGTELYSDQPERTAHRIREWGQRFLDEPFSEDAVATAADLVAQYWKWRRDPGPRGMVSIYTMAAVFAQSMFRSTRAQVPSQLQRSTVEHTLFYDRSDLAGDGGPVDQRFRILAMEILCNVYVRRKTQPIPSHVFVEDDDKRKAIMGYSARAVLPFCQISEQRPKCPVHYGRGEELLESIDDFETWFKTQYDSEGVVGHFSSRYTGSRSDIGDPRLFIAFSQSDIYNMWFEWETNRNAHGQCSPRVAEYLASPKYHAKLGGVIKRVLINVVAPGFFDATRNTLREASHALFQSSSLSLSLSDEDDDPEPEPQENGKRRYRKRKAPKMGKRGRVTPHGYVRFKRVHPVDAETGARMTPEEIATAFPITAEAVIQDQGMPLLEIAQRAEWENKIMMRPEWEKKLLKNDDDDFEHERQLDIHYADDNEWKEEY